MALELHRHIVERARLLAFDLITQGGGCAKLTVAHRLGIRAHDVAVDVEDAHGIGNHAENGGELADEMSKVLAKLLALRDVDGGEHQLTRRPFVAEGAEDGFEHANARSASDGEAQRAMDLAIGGLADGLAHIGIGGRECLTKGWHRRGGRLYAGELDESSIRQHEARRRRIEDRERRRDGVEKRLEASQALAKAILFA